MKLFGDTCREAAVQNTDGMLEYPTDNTEQSKDVCKNSFMIVD